MRYRILSIAIFSIAAGVLLSANGRIFTAKPAPQAAVDIDLDAAKDGPIYGDPEGLERVKRFERSLHDMHVRKDHPRLFITAGDIDMYRSRFKDKRARSNASDAVLSLAEKGDMVNLAFVYLMLGKESPEVAGRCARQAIQALVEIDPLAGDPRFVRQEIAKMALAFDWVYDAMSGDQRKYVVRKLSEAAGIKKRADAIRSGHKESGETFHREEWAFDSYNAWPEIALAHHDPDAEFVYKSRWNYDWYWGDAARMYAYAADGTPFEGYYCGADGADWLFALKTSTGINLVDGNDYPWCKNNAYYTLYRLDLDRGREVFHKGVSQGAGGCLSFSRGSLAWRIKKFFARTLPQACDNPYILWLVRNFFGVSDWTMTTAGYSSIGSLDGIANILFGDPASSASDLRTASYDDLPYARLFPGGNEAYMRTGWFGRPVIVGFRTTPSYTKTSHGDFDVNTFVIYKDGVLSPDSGVYDIPQSNYFGYQKNTVAHNNILVVDPSMPDEPTKLAGRKPDPGGVDCVFTRTFGSPSGFGLTDAFLHNPHADWADIVAFKTTSEYDYLVGEAAKAYRDRLSIYYRTLVFIRKDASAYLIIYDKLQLKKKDLQVKWLLHLVAEPGINGNRIKAEVPGHIELFDGNFLSAENAFGTSKLYLKTLKPVRQIIRKVGGDGYEYWVDGTKPRNYPLTEETIKKIEDHMDGKWQEAGTWRIELIPQDKKREYDFINVIYIGDADEPFNPDNVVLREDDSSYNIEITDEVVPTNITFLKGEEPRGGIVIKDKISERFPEIGVNKGE